VRESASDCTLTTVEGLGSGGETSYPMSLKRPFPHPGNALYIGQAGRTFQTRYKEDIQAIWNNNDNSGYSIHILNTGHAYGNINNTMRIIKIEKKRKTSDHTGEIPYI
jgi:hypothetical protein